MSTADNRLFVAAIIVVLTLAIGSLWYNHQLETVVSTGAREVDMDLINQQISSGNLSDHEADFYKPFEGGDHGL